jgi:hypothetical protein
MYMEAQESNAQLRQLFAMNSRLPEWSNPHCYLACKPKHPERLVPKAEICEAFELTNAEYELLHNPEKKVRNKARLVKGLVDKEAIKIVDDRWMINPAIRLAQGWWSPYMYGVFLVDWENEHWTTCRTSDKSQSDSLFLDLGASFARNVQAEML